MTDTRDAFEAWFAKRRGAAMLSKTAYGSYEWARTSEACEVWQAATAAERERCALVCDDRSDCANDMKNTQARAACDELADAIRSGK